MLNFDLYKNGKLNNWKIKSFIKEFPEKYQEILVYTSFLPAHSTDQERFFCYLNSITLITPCKQCGNHTKYSVIKYQDFCSTKCANSNIDKKEKTKLNNIEKYGVDNPAKSNIVQEKIKKSNLEKYGVEHTFQVSEFREKSKATLINKYGCENIRNSSYYKEKFENTCLEKYGVTHHSKTENYKNKCKLTSLKRYGVDNPMQLDFVQQKIKQNNLEKYGVNHHMKTKESKEKIKKSNLEKYGVEHHKRKNNLSAFDLLENKEWLEHQYGKFSAWKIGENISVSQSCVSKYIRSHGIEGNWKRNSHFELELYNFISPYFYVLLNSKEIIPPKELDIYIPGKNLAIEFNGIYWHSDLYKDDAYHLNKTIECEKKGIQLLHIFENEWIEKQEIWKSVIKSKLGLNERIYARKCIVKEVSNIEGYKFFEETHIQGGLRNGKHIGLYYNNELVCCISYGKSRFEKDVYEIYRYSNKLNVNVVGGFSKLLKNLPRPIISYANRRWSNGNLYEKNGFDLASFTDPNYFYVVGGELHSRQRYQKHKLKGMKSYDENLTEEQIMELEGYRRIYDCGNLKYKISFF